MKKNIGRILKWNKRGFGHFYKNILFQMKEKNHFFIIKIFLINIFIYNEIKYTNLLIDFFRLYYVIL